MITATVHGRIGRDAELRYTPNGDAVADLALGCNYGRKGEDGNYPTQWVKASLWGKQAEALCEHLVNGTGIIAILSDVNVKTYTTKDGAVGNSLEGRVMAIEFTGAKPREEQGRSQAPQSQRAPAAAPRAAAPKPQQAAASLADMEDDIPF